MRVGALLLTVVALLAGCAATKIVTVPARVAAKAVSAGAKIVGHAAKAIN
jgi:hypothetical protein